MIYIPIMIEKLEFTENQRFQFGRFEAAHNVLWAMQVCRAWYISKWRKSTVG